MRNAAAREIDVNAKTLIESGSNRDYAMPDLEKGVPIPPDALRFDKRNERRSPWPGFIRSMDIGDSFVVGWGQAQNLRQHFDFMGLLCAYRVLKGSRGPNGTVQVRVWRIG